MTNYKEILRLHSLGINVTVKPPRGLPPKHISAKGRVNNFSQIDSRALV